MNKRARKHRGVYELYFKDEYLTEAATVIEATELIQRYNKRFNTNSVKLKFRYDN